MFQMDSNEAAKEAKIRGELLPYLGAEVPVIFGPLDAADLSFTGRGEDGKPSLSFGVEFKLTASDVIASIRDGRIPSQLIRMVNLYDISYLLLIGQPLKVNFDTGKVMEHRKQEGKLKWIDGPFPYHYVNSIFARFEASGGRIRQVQDTEHAAAFLLSLYRYWDKESHSKEMFVKKRYKLLDWQQLDNPLAEVYERIRRPGEKNGIGIKRAIKLQEICPDLVSLVAMSEGDFARIPGFGRKTARKVYEVVHG